MIDDGTWRFVTIRPHCSAGWRIGKHAERATWLWLKISVAKGLQNWSRLALVRLLTLSHLHFWSVSFQSATKLWSVLSYLWTLWMRICQECTQTNLELVIFDLAILRNQWERTFCISSFQRDTSEHVLPVWHYCRGIIPTPMLSSISVFKSLPSPSASHTCESGNEI